MPVLNHHIVAARDKEATDRYFTEILGLEPAVRLGEFAVLRVSPDTTLDFVGDKGDFDRLHYAFLVTEAEFDEIFARIKERHIPCWFDPMHNDPDAINTWDDGRQAAAKTPWNARAVTSIAKPLAAPPTAEATENPSRPISNVRRRPTISDRRPPSSNRLPKASE